VTTSSPTVHRVDDRVERLVVGQDRRRVQDVVDVEPDVGPGPAEAQNLRKPDVDLVDAIAIQRAGSTRLTVTFGAAFANARPSVVCAAV
jgi:hypothetical protein